MSQKVKGDSLDISAENRHRLKALFPSVFTETINDQGVLVESVDFEKLKAELGTFTDLFEGRRERYSMEWPGKNDALSLIQAPSAATLKPCPEESINFDTTENLFIEGENLEVLKLLQKSYYGKVKMIYIDPPYNTGKDFIYHDNFTEPLDAYLEYAGLVDGNGKRFSTNTANEGRFHTNWLNMMYPRLYLARNLLRDDGVIFISIDDNEVSNLRKLCDEIFGEENFVCQFTREAIKGGSLSKFVRETHDYVLVFAKNLSVLEFAGYEKEEMVLNLKDSNGLYAKGRELNKWGADSRREDSPGMWFPIKGPNNEKVYPIRNDGSEGRWRLGKQKMEELVEVGNIIFEKRENGSYIAYEKIRGNKNKYTQFITILKDKYINAKAAEDLKALFNQERSIFDFSKPYILVEDLLVLANTSNSDSEIILDFFAGSATTAHAMLELNKVDGGNRKFILVQLPEPCATDSEAFKAGYKTIADIGKERLRRVIKNLNKEDKGQSEEDRGFRVLKLDKSNFRQWHKITSDAKPELIEKQLVMHIDHIDRGATTQDLLYEILLKEGFLLTEEIEIKKMAGKKLFSVAGGKLLICLEDSVTKGLIDGVIAIKPELFICLDSAFGDDDQLKANAVLAFNAINSEKNDKINFKTI